MPRPSEMTVDELKTALPSRLRERPYGSGDTACIVQQLDLRTKEWGKLGTIVLQDPSDPGWPGKGANTDDVDTATAWIEERYADWVYRKLRGDDAGLKVKDAIEPFIQAMHDDPTLGPDHGTVSSRRSYLRVHIAPALGDRRLLTLPSEPVQKLIDSMMVTKTEYGIRKQVPASKAAREGVLASLRAVFKHHFPSAEIPFKGIKVDVRKQEAAHQREMIQQGRANELIRKTTFTPDEIFLQLAAARYIDLHPEVGIIADWACRIMAPTLALQLAFASRISELVQVRERYVDEVLGFVLVAGSKSADALRYLPLQDAVRPWLAVLRAARKGPLRGEHYLLRTHPLRDELPNKDVYARRMGTIATLVGLKLPQERSHIHRRTHASWAMAKGVQPHEIKLFLGHAGVFGGATDEYIRVIREMTKPEHRRYIDIPSPDEVDAFLATGWKPPRLKPRNKGGRKKHS